MPTFICWTSKEDFRDQNGSPIAKWYLSSAKHSTLEHSRHFPTIRDLLADSEGDFTTGEDELIRHEYTHGQLRIFLRQAAHPEARDRFTYFGFKTEWQRIRNGTCQESTQHFLDSQFTINQLAENLGLRIKIPSDAWKSLDTH